MPGQVVVTRRGCSEMTKKLVALIDRHLRSGLPGLIRQGRREHRLPPPTPGSRGYILNFLHGIVSKIKVKGYFE